MKREHNGETTASILSKMLTFPAIPAFLGFSLGRWGREKWSRKCRVPGVPHRRFAATMDIHRGSRPPLSLSEWGIFTPNAHPPRNSLSLTSLFTYQTLDKSAAFMTIMLLQNKAMIALCSCRSFHFCLSIE